MSYNVLEEFTTSICSLKAHLYYHVLAKFSVLHKIDLSMRNLEKNYLYYASLDVLEKMYAKLS